MANNFSLDTITAQATPSGRGGVGIVRVSGPLVTSIAQAILGKLPNPRYADFCRFFSKEQKVIDKEQKAIDKKKKTK